MFVVSLSYIVPLDQVEPAMDEHMAFLERCYADGTFLASGRKVPRTGGVILARAESREALETILAEDPFWHLKLAAFEVTEVVVSRTIPGLEGLKG